MNEDEKKRMILDRAKSRAEQCADIARQHSGNVAALYRKAARMFRALARREVSDDKDDLLAASEAAEDFADAATKEASVLRRRRFGQSEQMTTRKPESGPAVASLGAESGALAGVPVRPVPFDNLRRWRRVVASIYNCCLGLAIGWRQSRLGMETWEIIRYAERHYYRGADGRYRRRRRSRSERRIAKCDSEEIV